MEIKSIHGQSNLKDRPGIDEGQMHARGYISLSHSRKLFSTGTMRAVNAAMLHTGDSPPAAGQPAGAAWAGLPAAVYIMPCAKLGIGLRARAHDKRRGMLKGLL